MRGRGLKDLITIQSKTVTRATDGAEIVAWATFAAVWAHVGSNRGREYLAAKKEGAEGSVPILIRYLSGVRPDMRVAFGSRTFEIVAPPIDRDGLGLDMILECVEVF